MNEIPTVGPGYASPGAAPGTRPTESQFTRNINAMNRLAEKLDGFIRVARLIHESTCALDAKIAAHSDQLARASAEHAAATREHIAEMRAVAQELRAVRAALENLARRMGA